MKKSWFLLIFTLLFVFNFVSVRAAEQTAPGLTLKVDQYADPVSPQTLDAWLSSRNVFNLSEDAANEIANPSYCPVQGIYCFLSLTNVRKQHLYLSLESQVDKEAITTHLEDLARKVNRDPEDAKFSAEDGKIIAFAEAKQGISLNITQSTALIAQTLDQNPGEKTIELPYESKKPTIDYADINNLGISALIGQGSSNFKGSPNNRIHNIKVATQRFNGLLIKPGEEFSFVKNLGEVDAEHGYLPELVIKKNVTEPEFGGGICQVSSTAFRAAIYSGLKISARRNHAYPVSYYNPQGMDSTVYVPQPDLRFINNTPGYILIQTRIVGTQLFFDFYGTDDGRKTNVDGPYITEKQPDGAMKTTFTQHVSSKDGQEFITDVFNSAYQSPYKFPHPGGPTLSTKPSNWSEEEWKNYKKMLKEIAKNSATKP